MFSALLSRYAHGVAAVILLACCVFNLPASDLVEVTGISDRIVALRFDDGFVSRHRLGQKVTDDVVHTSPLNVSELTPKIFHVTRDNRDTISVGHLSRKSKGTEFASIEEGYVFDGPKGAGFFPSKPYWAGEHWVYLSFVQPLEIGAKFRVRWDEKRLNTSSGEVSFTFIPRSFRSEAIHVNTLGYLPDAPQKFGYLYQWAGDAGGIDYSAWQDRPFWLVNATDGEICFQGTVQHRRDQGHQETAHGYTDSATKQFTPHDLLGCAVWDCDFSKFDTPGVYRLVIDRIGCSYPFRIAGDIYVTPFQAAMRAIYQQRSGVELARPFADGDRPAPHHPGKTPNFAGRLHYSTFRAIDMENEDLGSKADKAAIEAARKGNLDSTWGWYQDAGDWDGYVRHTMVPQKLLLLYGMMPDRFDDGQLELPESGNGIPDLLDEAAWLVRYFHRLRRELMEKGWGTGGVGGRVFPDAWGPDRPDNMANASWLDTKRDWYVTGEDPVATLRYAACAAQLAEHFRTLQVSDPEGVRWDVEAESAYEWAIANVRPGDEVELDRAVAAVALYRLTGEDSYHRQFLHDTAGIGPSGDTANLNELGQIAVGLYLTKNESLAGDADREAVLYKCLTGQTLFVSRISGEKRAMRWFGNFWQPGGIGFLTTPMVDAEVIAARVARDADPKSAAEYRGRVLTTADFFLGCNALHTTWMTGIGPRPPRELFQLDDFAMGRPMRVGLTPYGPIPHDYNSFWFKWPLRIPTSPCWAFDTTYPAIESNPESKVPTVPGTWPMGECFFNLATCPQLTEYTINQSLLATAVTYGSLLPKVEGQSLRGWHRWKRMHFSIQEILDGMATPQATPADDGVPNALKYAMGLSHPKMALKDPKVDIDASENSPRLAVTNGLNETETYWLVPTRAEDFQWKKMGDALFVRLKAEPTTVRIPLASPTTFGAGKRSAEETSTQSLVGEDTSAEDSVATATVQLTMPEVFSHNMVLQRDQRVRIFGTGAGSGTVTVTFADQTRTTTIRDGRWHVWLDPMPASDHPRSMKVTSANTLTFDNVVVGDVWLLSGQSNMAGPIKPPADEIENPKDKPTTYWPLVDGDVYPNLRFTMKKIGWKSVDGWIQRFCYAEGYFFGRQLHRDLKVPIGLIQAAYVNTDIAAWVDPQTRRQCHIEKCQGKHIGWCFDELIEPVAGFTIRGLVWNQGENDGGRQAEKDHYSEVLRTMLTHWQTDVFEQEFLTVVMQLPYIADQWHPPQSQPVEPMSGWAGIRHAQFEVLSLPRTALVTTYDCADGDIHPHNKDTTGYRAALAAEALMGVKNVQGMGPIFDRQESSGDELILYFHNAQGLTFANGATELSGMAIAGDDDVWHWAQGTISGNRLTLRNDSVAHPTQARYIWADHLKHFGNLVNGAGMPSPGFRSDGHVRVRSLDQDPTGESTRPTVKAK